MHILLIGSGGREHALAWKIRQSPLVEKLFIAPGNGGTATLGTNVPIKENDIGELVDFARRECVGLVVAGPELPLVLGLQEALEKAGIACFGPSTYAAQLEGSKAFAKKVMREAGVPTAEFEVFYSYEDALRYVHNASLPLVIKADGLAAGKGVVMAQTLAEAEAALKDMMISQVFGTAGSTVVIEETLCGEEASFLAFCDGTRIVPMPSLQDHKRVGDHDTGLNTGGMGAYSPAPALPAKNEAALADLCIRPILDYMADQGSPFKGVLYAGLMMTNQGPKVLEYNVRFGDPECQPLMLLLESDLVETMLACVHGRLEPSQVSFRNQHSCCVVMAANGYPQTYPTGMAITGIEDAHSIESVAVFQAGVRLDNGTLVTSGGRVLGVTALGATLAEARERAYQGVEKIHFEHKYFRKDIANKGLKRSPRVAIFMGSKSDEATVRPCAEILDKLGVCYSFTVTSAHRTPERTVRLVRELEEAGVQVFICAAGLAAHLAGAVAAQTIRPVLGIPVTASPLAGLDSLLATVQMPSGFPVGTVALDKVGARNAAWLSAQILALHDPELGARIVEERAKMAVQVEEDAKSF